MGELDVGATRNLGGPQHENARYEDDSLVSRSRKLKDYPWPRTFRAAIRTP